MKFNRDMAKAQQALERHFGREFLDLSDDRGYNALAFYTLRDDDGFIRDKGWRYDTSMRGMLPPELYRYADRAYKVDNVLRGDFSQPLSTGAKVGIGAAVVTTIGAIWALVRGGSKR